MMNRSEYRSGTVSVNVDWYLIHLVDELNGKGIEVFGLD